MSTTNTGVDGMPMPGRRRIRAAVLQGESLRAEEMVPGASVEEMGLEITLLRTLQQVIWYCANNEPSLLIVGGLPSAAKTAEACRKLREQYDIPILLISNDMQPEEIAACVESGADDYAQGSDEPILYTAKLKSLLRRSSLTSSDSTSIRIRGLTIDLVHHRVAVEGSTVLLTPVEFRMLVCLARSAGRPVPAATMLEEAQDYECDEQEAQEIVKVHVHRLRQKIEKDPARPSYILNVRGMGYMLERRVPFMEGIASGS